VKDRHDPDRRFWLGRRGRDSRGEHAPFPFESRDTPLQAVCLVELESGHRQLVLRLQAG